MTRSWYVMLALTMATWAAFLYFFWLQPESLIDPVPVHWSIHFEPDHTVPRDQVWVYFLLYPLLMTLLLVLTVVLPWLSPKNFQVDSFRSVFDYVMALAAALLAYLGALHFRTALTGDPLSGAAFVGGFFLFFALLGNVMDKVKRNFWMGVRTPWTLASETVWVRTHRLAGWLWVSAGLAGFVGVLLGLPYWLCFAGLMVAVLYPVLYSLILYKRLEKQGKIP